MPRMHDVVVVVGGGLVVVVVGGTVVVVVGGGPAVEVVVVGDPGVVVGAAGVVVGAAGVAVPGVSTSDAVAGAVDVPARRGVLVVVVTAPPGTLETVVGEVLGEGGAGVVVGPERGTGPPSCRACVGRRGVEPPGAKATRTASRRPTTASPANMPARCERGRSSGASVNSASPRCPRCAEVPGVAVRRCAAYAGVGPHPVLVHVDPFLVRRRGAGGSHQRKPRVARKHTVGSGPRPPAAGAPRTAVDGPRPRG